MLSLGGANLSTRGGGFAGLGPQPASSVHGRSWHEAGSKGSGTCTGMMGVQAILVDVSQHMQGHMQVKLLCGCV